MHSQCMFYCKVISDDWLCGKPPSGETGKSIGSNWCGTRLKVDVTVYSMSAVAVHKQRVDILMGKDEHKKKANLHALS